MPDKDDKHPVDFAKPIPKPRELAASDLVAGHQQLMPTAQLTGDGAVANDLSLWDGAKWVPDHTVYGTAASVTAEAAARAAADTTLTTAITTEASARAAADALLAPLASPTFTGTVTAPNISATSTGVIASLVVGKMAGTVISPAQIVANTNNYNPTGLSAATIIHLSTDANRDLTGLQGGSAGRVLLMHNNGSQPLTLKHNSGSSSANNQFLCPNSLDMVLVSNFWVTLVWDNTFWYVDGARATSAGVSSQTPGAVAIVNIPHTLGTSPIGYSVLPANLNSATAMQALGYYLTSDNTNLIVTFTAALTPATVYDFVWQATL